MRTIISALLLASAIATPASAGEISDDQFSVMRLFMEAKLASKFCAEDGVKINEGYFSKAMASVPKLNDADMNDVFVATSHYHAKDLRENPRKWCSEYTSAIKKNFDWSDDAPVTFKGFGS